ncbi:unnamed protein product [Penicillium nalgiovense]|uniref:Uncharacterized protein n=1 Tax=Penicillium nalgiovense TaxID=60175 RepID=A0A9W4N6U3_PENNA|nr:unnamed protein product [Penicillium nalgiovense]CAG8185938.1 unnamed protein product [Penicillium nalgiovense]CAG8230755.1 unnamed protein product [Penicillium nalgiovense]CAG8255174.1 unnamed protein product [Penicillium nalgiovense]CAG8261257.1 unnamed protein product [Penicillium nalgiovense]
MFSEQNIPKALQERLARAISRGFTRDYQDEKEKEGNTVCHPELAPATLEKYNRTVDNWALWRISRNESTDPNFPNLPVPTPELLKLFAEFYIKSCKKVPSQQSACNHFTSFTSKWERETSQSLPKEVKDDVLNYIRTELTVEYKLPTKPRERFLVNGKDIAYLLRHLFVDDCHDYIHERARVQTASSLSLFAGSGARAGAVVESSAYRKSNECLYYRHLSFHLKWSKERGSLIRWVTIDPEFLKGWRYRDDTTLPKNWFREHPVLGMSFVFWVIVHGVADGAFKGLATVTEVLAAKPPNGRESWTLEWNETTKDLPFFRRVTAQGPDPTKALTFSSLRHNFTTLAQRDGFKDQLRVHGIRGGIANKIDPKASQATRSQALDHQNHNTYLKYQSSLKALDIQALFYDLDPDYECRDMEQSMSHHRDSNVPLKLNAATTAQFESDDEIVKINQRIAHLTQEIAGRLEENRDLVFERDRLYNKKAKRLLAWKKDFIKNWWDTSYTEYVSGNDFSERDPTPLFDIYKKYLPERSRLSENLLKKETLDSELGRQCLEDMVTICMSTERAIYYPGIAPEEGRCPICNKSILDIPLQGRAKHMLQCRRKSLNGAQYQQRYKNEKRAHRRVQRSFVQFCYLCAELFLDEDSWENHCKCHLDNLNPRCGLLTFRSTLVAPGFCPFCLGDESKKPDERFQQWVAKSTLLNHIDEHLGSADSSAAVFCPHPCCEERKYVDNLHLQWHFFDAHSIEEPRSNCVKRKRKWQLQSEPAGTTFGNLSDETLPSLEDYFLTSTLPTSFEDSDMTSADDLFMEFVRLDDD